MLSPIGFIGKVPSHGDFVKRQIPQEFDDIWMPWLHSALVSSQECLDSHWIKTYLTSPVWKFSLGPGVCGLPTYVGLFFPSVDSVGRYFPFTLVKRLGRLPWSLNQSSLHWYEGLEQLAMKVLGEGFQWEDFCENLTAWNAASAFLLEPDSPGEGHASTHFPLAHGNIHSHVLNEILSVPDLRTRSLFWTQGSDQVEPCAIMSQGLPQPSDFFAFLNGNFAEARFLTQNSVKGKSQW